MPIDKTVTEFNRYSVDFQIARHQKVQYTRAIWDGEVLSIYSEDNKKNVSLEYSAPVSTFTLLDKNTAKWIDPFSGKTFTLSKTTGCGCKYNKRALSKLKDPAEALDDA